jgi:hypothetical protein
MKRPIVLSLAATAVLASSAASAWAWGTCPFPGGSAGTVLGGSVKIKGTFYEADGSPTTVSCDSNSGAGLLMQTFHFVNTTIETPAEIHLFTTGCGGLDYILSEFAGSPSGPAHQVVINGSPRRECVFHGGTSGSTHLANWVMFTRRRFDSSGIPTAETGTLSVNDSQGRIFTGRISVRYP